MNRVESWLEALRARQGERLTFPEIRKGVTALSRIYVEERGRIGADVFGGAGKRAAFACFYTPLHFLLVREIVLALDAQDPPPRRILDLGCGLAPASAAWSLAAGGTSFILGVERQGWAAGEARRSLQGLGLRGRIVRQSVERAPRIGTGDGVVAAFAVNEFEAGARTTLLKRLLAAKKAAILIIEPIARRDHPWWTAWSRAFVEAGGRDDAWRFEVELPDWLSELDRASGLEHRELTGKSLFLRGSSESAGDG